MLVAGAAGSRTTELVEQTRRHGIADAVSFLGVRHDIPELLCAADAFVLSSRREGFSGAVLEAMALEAPIVASDLPQVREALDPECAVLAVPGSASALADAVERVLVGPADAATRTSRARQRFLETFTIDVVADQMVAFYVRALGGHR